MYFRTFTDIADCAKEEGSLQMFCRTLIYSSFDALSLHDCVGGRLTTVQTAKTKEKSSVLVHGSQNLHYNIVCVQSGLAST